MFEAPSTIVLAETSTFVGGAVVDSYVSTAIIALVVYDHAITLSDEIAYMWRHKPSAATFSFALNRYSVLAYGVVNFFSDYRKVRCPDPCKPSVVHSANGPIWRLLRSARVCARPMPAVHVAARILHQHDPSRG
ncbi:hypothetical protein PsYK624_107930 [Phanerochaete sordida]|uniref:DUF6533 domain-containing protein n=1 Tax=Phanerochaete sordida TaxID=48140 RepID=A0A9P3GGP9_9APHY|nr:hypothetical protein PsYK624_107930 [Phanerochaete sordida]